MPGLSAVYQKSYARPSVPICEPILSFLLADGNRWTRCNWLSTRLRDPVSANYGCVGKSSRIGITPDFGGRFKIGTGVTFSGKVVRNVVSVAIRSLTIWS